MRRILNLPLLLLTAVLLQACSLSGDWIPPIWSDDVQPLRVKPEVAYTRGFAPGSIRVLPSPQLPLNAAVQKEIRHFTMVDRRYIPEAIERRQKIYPMIAEIFRDEGLPLELLNVALIESGYRKDARSRSGAVGLWQFMKPTGRLYGLSINWINDERKDPVRSTIAAARHLKDLYRMFLDWDLAIAAYNAGPYGLQRAMRKGGSRDFWTLADKKLLKSQTRRYVPKFIAVSLILQNPRKYGFSELAPLLLAEREQLSRLG